MMDLDSLLVSLYVLVDDWWRERHPPSSLPNKPGRPALLCESEVLTLAILSQWPRFRSERDFWRFASWHLRPYFPKLCTQGQLKAGASEPCSPSCASCRGSSPRILLSLRPSSV